MCTCSIEVQALPYAMPMNVADIIFIYLALGAPFAVYNYFHFRDAVLSRRLMLAALWLLFWFPAVGFLAARHFINAYSGNYFVSSPDLDAPARRAAELRREITVRLISGGYGGPSNRLAVREIIERYVGLMSIENERPSNAKLVFPDLFAAAGRTDTKLAAVCLNRRNLKILDRHRTKARREFVALFESIHSGPAFSSAEDVIRPAIDLARELNDTKAMHALELIASQVRDELWNPHELQEATTTSPARPATLPMTASSLSND